MTDPFKPLSAGFGAQIQELERLATAALDLTERVRAALPNEARDHVISAGYRAEILVVLVDSPVWAPYVRYAQGELLASLKKSGETQFTKLKVRVRRPPRAAV